MYITLALEAIAFADFFCASQREDLFYFITITKTGDGRSFLAK
jgi:hypothetical protein